jgi:GDP-4-dehydro-6-deoxy-D-mannose reductase
MRALITGAYGFVGKYVAAELGEAGYSLILSDIAEPEVMANPPAAGSIYQQCDLLNFEDLSRMIREHQPGLIVHLAAQSSGGRSISNPGETFRTNISGFVNLMEGVRKYGEGSRVLAVGSGEEYGGKSPGEMPLGENSLPEPGNPYAASKVAQTMIATQYYRTYGIDVVATRSFNHTGPGQTDTFVLPSFARKCAEIEAGLREPVLKTGNLDIVRDFLDVRDVARAYRLLAEKGRAGRIYNVCSGEGLKLEEALDIIIAQFDIDVEKGKDPGLFRPADVPVFIGDNSRLVEETGWKKKISVDEMLSGLADYWRNRYAGERMDSGQK